MPAERLSMRQIRDVLRLRFASKLSQRAIAKSLRLSQGAVSTYLTRGWFLHAQNGGGKGRLIAWRRRHVGGHDQLAAVGADHRLGVVGLAVFVRLGFAHQLRV